MTSKDSINWLEFEALDPLAGHDHVGFRTVGRRSTLTEFKGTIKMCEFNQYTRYNCHEDASDPQVQHCEFECLPCHGDCETCSGPDNWNCKTCHAFASLDGGSCVCWGDDLTNWTGTNLSDPQSCVDPTTGCVRGEGFDIAACAPCDPICKYCNGPTFDECLGTETAPDSTTQSGCYTGFKFEATTSTDVDGVTTLYHNNCVREEGWEEDTRDTTGVTIYPDSGRNMPCFHY